MASFHFNNGLPKKIKLGNPLAKVFASVDIVVGDNSVKIAGHSILNLEGEVTIEDVQFENHPLATGNNLNDHKLVVIVDVSKFKIEENELVDSELAVKCRLKFSTKSTTLEECVMEDKTNPEPNTVFNYILIFTKQSG